MHRWRSDKIGILMDFSYLWRSSQWVLLFRTAKQKALLLKKQRREWSNYTYLRQKLVIISSLDLPGTTYPTRMIHNSMPPESDPKIFCCYRDREIERERESHPCRFSGQQLRHGSLGGVRQSYQMYPPSSASPSSSSSSSASSPLSSASFSSSSSQPTPLPKSPEYPATSSGKR